ncbi:MAG TPA: hypothetical protein PLI13_06315, partial [Paracoccus sp. (in: a-proteobacteria)]|nr:hypothetical protein [Paracoccus sp. (in: a-proteobacteria)]
MIASDFGLRRMTVRFFAKSKTTADRCNHCAESPADIASQQSSSFQNLSTGLRAIRSVQPMDEYFPMVKNLQIPLICSAS